MVDDFNEIKRFAHLFYPQDGFVIIAGKTDKDNEYISLKVAGQSDLWFHVRGMPGSHILLRSLNDSEPGKELMEMAASIAVWYSKGRNGGVTAVSMTSARNVSKPPGSPRGTVCIKNEKVLKVRPADFSHLRR